MKPGAEGEARQQPARELPARLGRNAGRYHGETIRIGEVLERLAASAVRRGWVADPILDAGDLILPAWIRRRPHATRRLYLSTGIHGDEPAGPLVAGELVEADQWPEDLEVWLCPCLNPTGFRENRRENAAGIDLNRQYAHLEAEEVRAHVEWLQRQPGFDLAVCLHEDWESNGFYLYELNPDGRPSHAEAMIRAVSSVCPIDLAPEIEGRPAQGGIIRPQSDPLQRPHWPEAFYLLMHKTRLSYTLEAPSDFALAVRVRALAQAVSALLERQAR